MITLRFKARVLSMPRAGSACPERAHPPIQQAEFHIQ